jgi:adenylate cyclase
MSRQARMMLEGVAPFAAAGILFGLLYNTLFYPRTLVEYLEAGTIGLLLGAAAGLVEHTVLERWLRRRSLIQAVALRTVLYAGVVAAALALVLSVEPAMLGECSYIRCVGAYVAGPLFLRDLAFSTVFVFFAAFSAHVVLLVGTRNFSRLLLGRYRKPRELSAVFMFVDLRGSTALAERLGHERYSAFLRDFFNDLAGPIHAARGEVHQFVGDEVVLVWSGERRTYHWLGCFLAMRDALRVTAPAYELEYGAVPTIKAGVHSGRVVVTEVGTVQRAHVYHGDVLNVASRIEAKCNETGFDLLASAAAVSGLDPDERAQLVEVGALPLRGKSEELTLYGLGSCARRLARQLAPGAL